MSPFLDIKGWLSGNRGLAIILREKGGKLATREEKKKSLNVILVVKERRPGGFFREKKWRSLRSLRKRGAVGNRESSLFFCFSLLV